MTFAELAKRVRGVRDALSRGELPTFRRVFSEGVLRDVRDGFTNAADPVTGVPWAPLQYRKGQILVVTGMLRQRTMEAANSPVHLEDGVLLEQTQPDYSKWHQRGTRLIPQRRHFGASRKTIGEARAAVCADIATVLKG